MDLPDGKWHLRDPGRDSEADPPHPFLSEAKAELELEIALRKRLVESLESRISWALLLRDSIAPGTGGTTPEAFRNVALDALSAVDSGSSVILSQDIPIPPSRHVPRPPPPRKSLPTNDPKTSFLYIRPSTLVSVGNATQLDYLLLQCPACTRTNFTALQGLLNHARLSHNLEWGTHDECVKACAIPGNGLDPQNGIEVGLGPAGILPGLRSIFQKAVGTNINSEQDERPKVDQVPVSAERVNPLSLNQTLGLHDESPGLAPFLGKVPIRRQIKVEDEEVVIDHVSSHQATTHRKWRATPFRRQDTVEVSDVDHGSSPVTGNVGTSVSDSGSDNLPSSQRDFDAAPIKTRFHIVSRVIITDRSLWVPLEKRAVGSEHFTHKWMVSLDSPSYANHISTILNSVEVTPSDGSPSIPLPPITSNPPFVVVGVASRPFLAKVKLKFVGARSSTHSMPEQVLTFEHWVDLFQLHENRIVVGEDQIVDIDLDKDSILKPAILDYIPIDARHHWIQDFTASGGGTQFIPVREKYEDILEKLRQGFPMIFKGKRSLQPKVPYCLAPSSQALFSKVTGRRKAIEWSLARAMQAAYCDEQKLQIAEVLPDLSVADVYAWLSENDHFVRPPREILVPVENTVDEGQRITEVGETERWCQTCGLEMWKHPRDEAVKSEMTLQSEEQKPITESQLGGTCSIVSAALQVTKLPRMDIENTRSRGLPPSEGFDRTIALDRSYLISAADPHLTEYIWRKTHLWKMSTFRSPLIDSTNFGTLAYLPTDRLGRCRQEVEETLEPHALLALLTGRFVCALVARGMEAANRDNSVATSLFSGMPRRRRTKANNQEVRVLTPRHILSGVLVRGQGRGSSYSPLDRVLLLVLSNIGVSVEGKSGVKVEE